jgi:hypothetical protein
MKYLFVVVVCVFLGGCAATYNKNFPLVEKGMNRARIQELIGKPVSAESGPGNSKVMYYRLASSRLDTDGSDTREYYVLFENGEVLGYGERKDEITMRREMRQFHAAWKGVDAMNESLKATQPKEVNVNVRRY